MADLPASPGLALAACGKEPVSRMAAAKALTLKPACEAVLFLRLTRYDWVYEPTEPACEAERAEDWRAPRLVGVVPSDWRCWAEGRVVWIS